MPKAERGELAALRAEVFARDMNTCQWPGCDYETSGTNPLQLAHLHHRGMGGSDSRNVKANCVTLCRIHHDILDGRQGIGKSRYELVTMLRSVCNL